MRAAAKQTPTMFGRVLSIGQSEEALAMRFFHAVLREWDDSEPTQPDEEKQGRVPSLELELTHCATRSSWLGFIQQATQNSYSKQHEVLSTTS